MVELLLPKQRMGVRFSLLAPEVEWKFTHFYDIKVGNDSYFVSVGIYKNKTRAVSSVGRALH